MGVKFFDNLGGTSFYNCDKCGVYLSNKSEIMSTNFTGVTGRAYLFKNVTNIRLGQCDKREMLTGIHFVRDVFCLNCGTKIGWMYELAIGDTERYKEGAITLEKKLINKVEGFEEEPRKLNQERQSNENPWTQDETSNSSPAPSVSTVQEAIRRRQARRHRNIFHGEEALNDENWYETFVRETFRNQTAEEEAMYRETERLVAASRMANRYRPMPTNFNARMQENLNLMRRDRDVGVGRFALQSAVIRQLGLQELPQQGAPQVGEVRGPLDDHPEENHRNEQVRNHNILPVDDADLVQQLLMNVNDVDPHMHNNHDEWDVFRRPN